MSKYWEVIRETKKITHVVPLNDLEVHDRASCQNMEDRTVCLCKCCPRKEYSNGSTIFIHSSFDGREGLEWAVDILTS